MGARIFAHDAVGNRDVQEECLSQCVTTHLTGTGGKPGQDRALPGALQGLWLATASLGGFW